jgi:hypothetical protein
MLRHAPVSALPRYPSLGSRPSPSPLASSVRAVAGFLLPQPPPLLQLYQRRKPALPGLASSPRQATGPTGSKPRQSSRPTSSSLTASGSNPSFPRHLVGGDRNTPSSAPRNTPRSVQLRGASATTDQSRRASVANSRVRFPSRRLWHHRESRGPPSGNAPTHRAWIGRPLIGSRAPVPASIGPDSHRNWASPLSYRSYHRGTGSTGSTPAGRAEAETAMSNPKAPEGLSIKKGPPLPMSNPITRTHSPGPLAQDFARQQVFKQNKSNFHSTSLKRTVSSQSVAKMIPSSVNRTALHPHGVQYVGLVASFLSGETRTNGTPGPSRSTPRSRKSFTTPPTLTMTALPLYGFGITP